MKPEEIEQESFRIILKELGPYSFSPAELAIVQRVIHATADFEYARLLAFSPMAIERGIRALKDGCRIITDVKMAAAGIDTRRLESFHGQVYCRIDQPETAASAEKLGLTRSAMAMRLSAPWLPGAIVAVGNAPTALLEVLRLAVEENCLPALVIGVPVGFVNASESKAMLAASSLDHITTLGRKGGSTVAAAIVNALLRLAGD